MVTEPDPNDVSQDEPRVVFDDAPTALPVTTPWYRRRAIFGGIALVVAAAIAALVFTNEGAHENKVDTSIAQSELRMPDGKYITIADYVSQNKITSTTVRRTEVGADPGAPVIGLGLLSGSTRTCQKDCSALRGVEVGASGRKSLAAIASERAYGAAQWESSVDPNDPPTMVVVLDKLTGAVDPAKILEYAPGELKNLPNYEPLAEDDSSSLSGYKAVQLAGRYTSDGKVRSIGQKTVVIPRGDATYVLQIFVESLDADAKTLATVTATVDELTVIEP